MSSGCTLLGLMRNLHRYEYERHRWRLLMLFLAQTFSLAYAISGFFILTEVSGCVLSELDYLGIDELPDHDICNNIFITAKRVTPEKASLAYLCFILAELLPFVFYFWLNEPHDCFVCLGKDPDRRFSVFQLTHRENMIREHQVQYGNGGFGVAGNLAVSEQISFGSELSSNTPITAPTTKVLVRVPVRRKTENLNLVGDSSQLFAGRLTLQQQRIGTERIPDYSMQDQTHFGNNITTNGAIIGA